jgi:hypothetical protein
MQAKRYFWDITMLFSDNQDSLQKKEVKYKKGGTQQLQQAHLCMKRTSMHHIRIAKGTTGTACESKISTT